MKSSRANSGRIKDRKKSSSSTLINADAGAVTHDYHYQNSKISGYDSVSYDQIMLTLFVTHHNLNYLCMEFGHMDKVIHARFYHGEIVCLLCSK